MAEDGALAKWSPTAKTVLWAGKQLRLLGPVGRNMLRDLKSAMLRDHFARIHTGLVHQVRLIPVVQSNSALAAQIAKQSATAYAEAMAVLLELPPNQVHACIKLFARTLQPIEDTPVLTWVRSEPADERPAMDASHAHTVGKNTVWSALMGVSDGERCWQVFRCFHCPDLNHRADYKNSRSDWPKHYKSTLVFPLRYIRNHLANQFVTMGFLAFDSPKAHAFGKLPCIFEHSGDPATYYDRLSDTAAFQLGAIMADILSMALRETHPDEQLGDQQHELEGER